MNLLFQIKKYFITVLFVITAFVSLNAQVYVNKAGYLTYANKLVYFSSPSDSFYIHEDSDGSTVFKGSSSLWKANDPSTGLTVYRGDFSSFVQQGKYYIKDIGGNKSSVFEISDTVFNDVVRKSLKGFYFQRCGYELKGTYAGEYFHPACHLYDGYFHSTTGETGKVDETGGWHDAGDYGKYIVNAGITAGTLLMAYDFFPQKFGYDNSDIPESGNNIPDILDEVKFELDWFFKMQRDDGGVYTKLTRKNFAAFIMPQSDTGLRYVYQVSSTATADFATVMARAYRSFLKFDAAFAGKCLNAAKKAWAFLEANPQIVPAGGFKNPSDTYTGEYGDNKDSDERLWAAAELMVSTGESTYINYFNQKYDSGIFSAEMGWPNVSSMAYLTYLNCDSSFIDSAIKNKLQLSLNTFCGNLLSQKINKDGFNVGIDSAEYYWGSNSAVLNKAILLIEGFEFTGNQNYYNAALYQLNYVLGANAHDLSFVTGIGDKHVMHPHHRPSYADNVAEPVPGLIAGGPNRKLEDDALKNRFDSSTPAALCYIDDTDSYSSNEIAINWNAPLVFVSGYFSNIKIPTGIKKKSFELIFTGFSLEQNYPNPFNPSTTIKFSIPQAGDANFASPAWVSLKVYDVIGKEITTLVNEQRQPGNYDVNFVGGKFSSGIYYYTLTVNGKSVTKKMIVLK